MLSQRENTIQDGSPKVEFLEKNENSAILSVSNSCSAAMNAIRRAVFSDVPMVNFHFQRFPHKEEHGLQTTHNELPSRFGKKNNHNNNDNIRNMVYDPNYKMHLDSMKTIESLVPLMVSPEFVGNYYSKFELENINTESRPDIHREIIGTRLSNLPVHVIPQNFQDRPDDYKFRLRAKNNHTVMNMNVNTSYIELDTELSTYTEVIDLALKEKQEELQRSYTESEYKEEVQRLARQFTQSVFPCSKYPNLMDLLDLPISEASKREIQIEANKEHRPVILKLRPGQEITLRFSLSLLTGNQSGTFVPVTKCHFKEINNNECDGTNDDSINGKSFVFEIEALTNLPVSFIWNTAIDSIIKRLNLLAMTIIASGDTNAFNTDKIKIQQMEFRGLHLIIFDIHDYWDSFFTCKKTGSEIKYVQNMNFGHTVGNLVQTYVYNREVKKNGEKKISKQCNREDIIENVVYCGYRVPHPLEKRLELSFAFHQLNPCDGDKIMRRISGLFNDVAQYIEKYKI